MPEAWPLPSESVIQKTKTLAKRSPAVEFEDLLQVKGSWILELGNVAD